ncbi:MAG: hypothetical protein HY908_20140, partial [Myxococcales bacterium]|nr:hypothetical protein [Myxococcales bacterium]
MSSARNGGRREGEGRGRLVLLQGGLAEPGALVDTEWQAFGARIGWQSSRAAHPDDYEEALAARIFGGRAPDDNVVPIEHARGHRAAQPAGVDAVAAGAEGGPGSRPGRHRATAVLAVAAVVVLVTA